MLPDHPSVSAVKTCNLLLLFSQPISFSNKVQAFFYVTYIRSSYFYLVLKNLVLQYSAENAGMLPQHFIFRNLIDRIYCASKFIHTLTKLAYSCVFMFIFSSPSVACVSRELIRLNARFLMHKNVEFCIINT